MAKKKTIRDAEAEIAELKRQLAAATAGGGEEAPVGAEYPKAKYKAVKVTDQHPHGYMVRRVNDAEAEADLGPEWKNSPLDLGIGERARASRPAKGAPQAPPPPRTPAPGGDEADL